MERPVGLTLRSAWHANQLRGQTAVANFTYTARVRLDVDAPLCGVEMEGLEGTLLAEDLELVDVLVATVVARVGETLRVLVGEDGAVGLHRRAARQVLRAEIRETCARGGGEHDGPRTR